MQPASGPAPRPVQPTPFDGSSFHAKELLQTTCRTCICHKPALAMQAVRFAGTPHAQLTMNRIHAPASTRHCSNISPGFLLHAKQLPRIPDYPLYPRLPAQPYAACYAPAHLLVLLFLHPSAHSPASNNRSHQPFPLLQCESFASCTCCSKSAISSLQDLIFSQRSRITLSSIPPCSNNP